MNAVHSTITPRSTPREFVLLATPWAEAPQPTLQTLLTPPLAGPGSPLKGYAIPITDFELEMFMDGFGDWDELDLDSSDMHKLFPHVAQFFFVGLDPHDREIVAEEVIVPVSTSSDGVPQFWKATAVILAQNDQQYDLDVSDSGELVRALQTRLGVDTYPGWYELTGKGGPNLSPKQLKRLVKGSAFEDYRHPNSIEVSSFTWYTGALGIHDGDSMNKSQLPVLQPELMAIRPSRRAPTKAQEYIHRSDRLVDHVPPVRHVHHPRRNAKVTRVSRTTLSCIAPSLQASTRCSPWNDGALVAKEIEVGVCTRLDHFARVPPRLRDSAPILPRGPVQRSRSVEQPVPSIRDQGLDLACLASLGPMDLCSDDVGVGRVRGDELGVRCACDGVMETAVVVDAKGLGEDACRERSGLGVLSVESGGEGGDGA